MCARQYILRAVRVGIFLGVILLAPGTAFSHQVYLFAWVEGDTVYTESYFGGKRKVAGGEIRVYSPSGKELVTGRTDDEGMFSFPVPQRTDLRIVLDASMGHRAEFLLKADEIHGGPTPADEKAIPSGNSGDSGKDPGEAVVPDGASVDMEPMRAMVEKVLAERLQPISRSLARLEHEQGPGLTEILGGLGYIFGLMGIYLYARSRYRGKDRA
ncbi:MAG: hypothetical protein PVG49_09500 [Desulfobacteraceae bacterium]|jgi:nickel transport protein